MPLAAYQQRPSYNVYEQTCLQMSTIKQSWLLITGLIVQQHSTFKHPAWFPRCFHRALCMLPAHRYMTQAHDVNIFMTARCPLYAHHSAEYSAAATWATCSISHELMHDVPNTSQQSAGAACITGRRHAVLPKSTYNTGLQVGCKLFSTQAWQSRRLCVAQASIWHGMAHSNLHTQDPHCHNFCNTCYAPIAYIL
eukprot:GHRR01026732.1.p1 GENE.GHRR01026732.1~~GHRR01026732.1.p1  ORF type:complete len:195 (+),score=32.22 GHRR01026732.1:1940-2524(+)